MRSTFNKIVLLGALLLLGASIGASAQTQINPNNQIRWPADCYTSPFMVYNQPTNTCILVSQGGTTLIFLGTWSPVITYAQNNVVYFNGSSYVSLQNNNLDNEPDTSPSYWAILVSGGSIQLQTNGVANGSQTLLNIVGTGITNSGGTVNIPAGGGGITSLTGGVTGAGTGAVATTITPTGVNPGTYTLGGVALTVNAGGQITGLGNPFAMGMSCTAAGSFELGFVSTNPNVCTMSYSNGTVASATLSDGTNTTTLTTPFTTGNLNFAYSSNTTFTGRSTATNAQTASATQNFTVSYCTFAGVGSTGGTGATASGTGNCTSGETATITGAASTVLASLGLGNTTTASHGTVTPSAQYIVLLLSGGCGHSISINSFVSTFTTQAVTYTNALGGSQTGMCIYTGTTALTGTYAWAVTAL